jgi:hypothetical protein
MYVICIKENKDNSYFKLGERYDIIDVDIYEYATGTYDNPIWFLKNDIEHFEYHV